MSMASGSMDATVDERGYLFGDIAMRVGILALNMKTMAVQGLRVDKVKKRVLHMSLNAFIGRVGAGNAPPTLALLEREHSIRRESLHVAFSGHAITVWLGSCSCTTWLLQACWHRLW